MDSTFVTERHFTDLAALREFGKRVRDRMLTSEIDLGYFERQTVESPVTSIVRIPNSDKPCLNGDISLENHANFLTGESAPAADMSSLNLAQNKPGRSNRLAARSITLTTQLLL